MTETREAQLSGGCQCGAVRYALYAEPFNPHICHCRMCQKAFGGFFAPLAVVRNEDFAWTRGEAKIFASSSITDRGFCSDCGTPLTFRHTDTDRIDVSIGSLDRPADVQPQNQFGVEGRLPWFDQLHSLPTSVTEESIAPERMARLASRQHPDHDTETWPPA